MLDNSTSYIPPKKEKDLLAATQNRITMNQMEVERLSELKSSIQKDIKALQAELASTQGDAERDSKTRDQIAAEIKSSQKELNKLTEENHKLEQAVAILKSKQSGLLDAHETRMKELKAKELAVQELQRKADASIREAKQLKEEFDNKRFMAIEVLKTL